MKKLCVGTRIPVFWGEDMDWGGSRSSNRKKISKKRAHSWRRIMDKAICQKELCHNVASNSNNLI